MPLEHNGIELPWRTVGLEKCFVLGWCVSKAVWNRDTLRDCNPRRPGFGTAKPNDPEYSDWNLPSSGIIGFKLCLKALLFCGKREGITQITWPVSIVLMQEGPSHYGRHHS